MAVVERVRPVARSGTRDRAPIDRSAGRFRPWRTTFVGDADGGDRARSGTVGSPEARIVPATVSVALMLNTADHGPRAAGVVHGPHERPVRVDGECSAPYIQLTMGPSVAVRVLGLPLGALGEGQVDLPEVLGAEGRRLVERVGAEPDRTRQTALIARSLAPRLARGPGLTPEIGHCWRRLSASGGHLSIGTLPTEVGWTHQHLIERFRREIGVTPKTAACLLRLERLWRALDRVDAGTGGYRWSDLAVESGYTDQSHLIREFRRFTGTTPTVYLTRRRPGEHGGPMRPGPMG